MVGRTVGGGGLRERLGGEHDAIYGDGQKRLSARRATGRAYGVLSGPLEPFRVWGSVGALQRAGADHDCELHSVVWGQQAILPEELRSRVAGRARFQAMQVSDDRARPASDERGGEAPGQPEGRVQAARAAGRTRAWPEKSETTQSVRAKVSGPACALSL